jgi:acetyltransferase-like isoleucine patch superfamily enzyme
MKKILNLLKWLIKPVAYPLIRKVIYWLDYCSNHVHRENLLAGLKSHGKDCVFQWPIQMTGLEDIELGDNISIASFVHMWGEGGISIGDRVMIGSHTAISSITHDYNQYYMFNTLLKGKVIIEDDVWIGAHAVIMPGVTIGKGAVVGAGSVVTKNVEPFTIVTGIPARKYKIRSVVKLDRKPAV